MIKLLLGLILLTALNSNAQIINFPDSNFKDFLLNYPTLAGGPIIDTNGDSEIQVSEAFNFGFVSPEMSITAHGISNITGIEHFTTISRLNIGNTSITTLNLTGLNIAELEISGNFNLTGANITLSNPIYLTTIWINSCNIGALDLGTAYTNIEAISVLSSQLTSINLSGCTALQVLEMTDNPITTLNLDGLANLYYVRCNRSQLTSISAVGTATVSPFGFDLDCSENQFTNLDLSGTRLGTLECRQNLLLATINLENSLNRTLDCSYCPRLHYINIRNALNMYSPGPASIFCPNLRYICADQGEISLVQDYLTQYSIPNVIVNSQCVFTPTGSSIYTVGGTIRMDNDNNGCTVSDPPVINSRVRIYNAAQQVEEYASYPSGSYWFYAFEGDFEITPQINLNYFNVNPAPSTTVSVGPGNPNQVTDFCVSANGVHYDLEIVFIPTTPARPGFEASYQVVYRNKGNQPLSGNVELQFNDTRLDFLIADPAVSTQSVSSLSWVYANLLPFETRTINVTFSILPPPLNNIGDTLTFYGIGNPVVNDEATYDNYFKVDQVLTGGFDPNDKTCLEGKYIDVTHIGEYIHYVIRFQNTGNDTAFNVVVQDMLSANYDWNSFEIIKTSHPYLFKQTLGNKIEFFFPNIKLPAQSVNDAGSNGFIAFKIKPVNTIGFQDSLINNASIFFDFNLPVITNNAISIIDSAGLIPVSIEYFRGARVNNKNILSWKANCTGSHILFSIERSTDNRTFNQIGSITASSIRCLQPFDFSDNNPQPGINYYRIKMADADGKIFYSITIALLNKEKGFELISMLPNPVTTGKALLNFSSGKDQHIRISITDAMGKQVQLISASINAGSGQLDMNFDNFAPGVYYITINTEQGEKRTLIINRYQ